MFDHILKSVCLSIDKLNPCFAYRQKQTGEEGEGNMCREKGKTGRARERGEKRPNKENVQNFLNVSALTQAESPIQCALVIILSAAAYIQAQ